MILRHAFFKKTQQTNPTDIELATKRLKEWKHGNSSEHTELLIEFGQATKGKTALETQMILNHKQAIEYLVLDPS